MANDHDDTDGHSEAVSLADWNRVESHLRRLAGTVTASDDRLELRSGSARFAVRRDGRVEAGMPLHDLTTGRVTALSFDHGRGSIRLVTDDGAVEYEFRLP